MKYIEIGKWELRPVIYGFSIAVGFFFLTVILGSNWNKYYLPFSLVLFVVIIAELYVTANHYHVQHKKNSKALYEFEHHKFVQYSHHIILPAALYFGLCLFLFFNNQPSIYFLIIVVTFFLFTLLFENIYAFYRHKFSLNKSTNYIYDLLTLILVFLWINNILNFVEYNALPIVTTTILMLIVLGVAIYLLTIRHSITKREIFLAVFMTVFITVLASLLIDFSSSNILLSFLIAILYQTYTLYINYSIERVIGKDEVYEYSLMLLLILAILNLYGL